MSNTKLRVYREPLYPSSYAAHVYDWTGDVPVEDQARAQIARVSRLPFVTQMAVMPDCHYGMGATIGTIIKTEGAIIPAAVGVDIGCGILGYRTDISRGEILGKEDALRQYIQETIPNGRTANGAEGDVGKWGTKYKAPQIVLNAISDLLPEYEMLTDGRDCLSPLKHPFVKDHLGTLGTGNHFIEIAVDEADILWVLVHSGSRGPGAKFANHWMKVAKALSKQWHIPLEDPDLAYLPVGTDEFRNYWDHTMWALKYAARSRHIMATLAFEALQKFTALGGSVIQKVDTSHNYVEGKAGVFTTRKGASKALVGELSVMPGSMGTRSYIVEGKSNPKSLFSCSHGAGRSMSRSQAKKSFTLDDHLKATDGVYCRKDEGVLDETPGAYKDIDMVLAQQDELVTVKHTLKALVNVKG